MEFKDKFDDPNDPRSKGLPPGEFLADLVRSLGIERVYYPGSGDDFTLGTVFAPEGVHYVDRSSYDAQQFRSEKPPGFFIRADIEKSPFKDGVFDAAYIQDLHAEEGEFRDVLRTVRAGGFIIFSLDDCMDGDEDDLANIRDVSTLWEMDFPNQSGMFKIFRKITR